MRFAFTIPPRLLIAATIVVGILMVLSAFWELDQSRRELSHVVREEALSLVETIDRSSVNTILASDQIEALLAERLLNNAWLVAWLDSTGLLTQERLAQIAAANGIHRINVFDRNARRVLSSHLPEDGHEGRIASHAPGAFIAPVLRGETATLIIGLKQARFEEGQRYAVAVRRTGRSAGAIVLNLDAAELLDFRLRIGIGKLIRDLGDNSGIEFAALQDAEGIIAASGTVTELSSFAADTLLGRVMAGGTTVMREATFGGKPVVEAIHPLVLDDTATGVLRIGLSTDELRAVEVRMQRRMLVISLVLLVLATLVTMTIVAGRNYRRVEQELQRKEKLSALGELASGVAHEIRNPLNAIAMTAQRFEQEFVPRKGAAEYRALTAVLRTEARRVNGIIQHFLRFARPPKLQRTPAGLRELLAHVITLLGAQAQDRGVALTVEHEGEGMLSLDRDQMTQALLNILLNALEATPAGGTISIRTRMDHHGGTVSIADTGRGIPADALPRIFDLYYTTRPDGTGMGLPMTQQIIAQHGGTVDVESTEGKGTRFTVTLPAV